MLYGPDIAQLKIVIEGIVPPIWRRLLVPRETVLGDLHHMIQAAFGWWDYQVGLPPPRVRDRRIALWRPRTA